MSPVGDRVTVTRGGTLRQGITLGGIDVVLVALPDDLDEVRRLTTDAVNQHGTGILRRSAHSPDPGGWRPTAAPVADLLEGRLLGYVELADG